MSSNRKLFAQSRLGNDNSLANEEVSRQLEEIARSREGNYMDVDALNFGAATKFGQGEPINFSAELSRMKDVLDTLKAILPENKWLHSSIQDKVRGFVGGAVNEELRFKAREATQQGRGRGKRPLGRRQVFF